MPRVHPYHFYLQIFCLLTQFFCTVPWKDKTPRIKLEQFQRPTDRGRVALPNPWLYYLAAQMQHLIGVFADAVDDSTLRSHPLYQ